MSYRLRALVGCLARWGTCASVFSRRLKVEVVACTTTKPATTVARIHPSSKPRAAAERLDGLKLRPILTSPTGAAKKVDGEEAASGSGTVGDGCYT